MDLFRKKKDPISDRSRELNRQIVELEAQIKKLNTQVEEPPAPRWRSTATPGQSSAPVASVSAATLPVRSTEPIFEKIDQHKLEERLAVPNTAEHYNTQGVRKYDLAEQFRRLVQYFKGPTTSNPKLVSYLAAGSIQGLQPLRFEKRVARNRFIALVGFLVLTLWVILALLLKNHR
jgi:hypothetical protein